MADRLMGIETEYALVAQRSDGTAVNRAEAVSGLMALAESKLVHLKGGGASGMFLENGARLYVDCGHHPEMTTPECSSPWDVVRYVKAGDRILHSLATRLGSKVRNLDEALLFRNNVDYSGTGATWGCHESYLHRVAPSILADQIIPHLVSRIVFAGAGGFDSRSPGLCFTLSARAPHIVRIVSGSSTHHRGIFHTKNEPLCGGGYRRLHVLCGDSLCSEKAMALAVGATALVVAMVEGGVRPVHGFRLSAPLKALRTFAHDTDCTASVRLTRSRTTSALAIQRRYLTEAENHLHESFMPSWAPELCEDWRLALDRLERDPREMSRTLDWAIKLALYRDRAGRRGVDWELLPFWTSVMEKVKRLLDKTDHAGEPIGLDIIRGRRSPIREKVRRLTPQLSRRKLTWDDLGTFLALRNELLEIDTRFSQLGKAGIFNSLDRAGVLQHREAKVGRVAQAVSEPPATGRAHLRGRVVRRLASREERGMCDWGCVWSGDFSRVLDLSDPFETRERWEQQRQIDIAFRPVPRDLLTMLESMGL